MAITREQLDQIYQEDLGRPLGAEGEEYWLNQSGLSDINQIRNSIRQSQEYQDFQSSPVQAFNTSNQNRIDLANNQPTFADTLSQGAMQNANLIGGAALGVMGGGGQSRLTLDPRTGTDGGDGRTIGLPYIPAPEWPEPTDTFPIERPILPQMPTIPGQTPSSLQVPEGYSVPQLTNVLNDVYTQVLGRPVGKEGQQYWIGEFNNLVRSGVPPEQANEQIYNSIVNSAEAEAFKLTGVSTGLPPQDQRVEGIIYGDEPTMTDVIEQRMQDPTLPDGAELKAETVTTDPSQFIGADSGVGQVGDVTTADQATVGDASVAGEVTAQDAVTTQAKLVSDDVSRALDKVNPALGSVSEKAQVEAVTMSPTSTDVGTIPPAQLAEAQRIEQPQSRTLQSAELVQSAVDAQKATAFVEEVQSASADPTAKATVQGQLADLMGQFEDGQVPTWAAGAMRTANATLAARGLGASSIAGQAVVQAAMESAIPIAVQDAQTQSQFEQQNLSNRQQRAMLAAQQRAQFMGQEFDQEFQARVANAAKVSDIANMNFTAEQQIAIENARLAQSVDLANLSNQQAMVMAETAQISQLELSNLNNRQQAAVQNAQAFLQMDLTNLSNRQQTTMFDAQSRVNALLSDAAAENASRQFNATSENQTNQFFQSLQTQVQQFNANQLNTMEQIRAEQSNMMSRFNAQLMAQQEQFNATNQLAIAQSDAQWNRQIATLDTAAINSANQFNAQAILEMSNQAFANAAQILRDQMDYAFQAGQKDADRELQIVIQKMSQDASKYAADAQEDAAWSTAVGTLAAAVLL